MVLSRPNSKLVFPPAITDTQALNYVRGRDNGIRALSLWQPWATLVALGVKQYETRNWGTAYRGPVAIHAARRWTSDLKSMCLTVPFSRVFEAAEINDPIRYMPLGVVVALAVIERCVWIDKEPDFAPARDTLEYAFGDYTPDAGRVAWVLRTVRRVEPPIPVKGAMGLWTWMG